MKFEPDWRAEKKQHRKQLRSLKKRIAEAERDGHETACAREIAEEVRWLLSYTARFDRARRRLGDLAEVVSAEDPDDPTGESYYFGISFLDEMGYFDPARQFWSDEAHPESRIILRRLMQQVSRVKARRRGSDPMLSSALWKLERAARSLR